MARVTYEQSEANRPPPFLRRKWGALWDNAWRFMLDCMRDGLVMAIRCRFAADAPTDALPYLGRERMLEQGPSTSEGTYRLQLDAAWTTWAKGGTALGIAQSLKDYFSLTNVVVYSKNGDDFTADDAAIDNWPRFWVVIGQPNPWAEWLFDPAVTFGVDLVFGTTMTKTEYRAAIRHCERWRPAHVLGVELILLQAGSPDTPAAVNVTPALRYVSPNISLSLGQFFGYPGGIGTFGPGEVFGYYLPES